jgi:ribosomal protein S15P/S13E
VETNSTKPGSRGVVLYPGDVLQFGASTRIYCLEGPDEFQRGAIRVPVVPAKKTSPAPAAQLTTQAEEDPGSNDDENDENNGFVSWGISMDDEAQQQQHERQSEEEALLRQQTLENGENIPDKHRKAWEKLAALKFKLKNLQTESERIRRKGELTTGQENQLRRNQEREEQLQEKILERENDLFEKLHPDKAKGTSNKKTQYEEFADDEEDDFFDRTKNRDTSSAVQDEETEESLLEKWKNFKEQLHRKDEASRRARERVENIRHRLELLKASGDEEAFFVQNDLKLAEEQLQKVQGDLNNIRQDMEETRKLLKIVNPRIILDEEKGSDMVPPRGRKVIYDASSDSMMDASAVMPPPKSKHSNPEANDRTQTTDMPKAESSSNDIMMPPPKRAKRSIGPAMPPPTFSATEDKKDQSSPASSSNSDRGKVKGPTKPTPMGTLAALKAVASSDVNHSLSSEKNPRQAASGHSEDATKKAFKKDEWRAPEDQDGSGMTKLNAKFAGRY